MSADHTSIASTERPARWCGPARKRWSRSEHVEGSLIQVPESLELGILNLYECKAYVEGILCLKLLRLNCLMHMHRCEYVALMIHCASLQTLNPKP